MNKEENTKLQSNISMAQLQNTSENHNDVIRLQTLSKYYNRYRKVLTKESTCMSYNPPTCCSH